MSEQSNPSALLRAADASVRAGRAGEAEAIYQRVLEADPSNAAALLDWGRLRRILGFARHSAQLLQLALDAGAGAAGQVEMAALLIDHRQIGQAEKLLRQALAREPQMAAAHFQLGRMEAARGQLERSVDCFRVATRADPTMLLARIELAGALAAIGRLEEAAAAYHALLKRAPQHQRGLLGLGWVLGQQHRFADALACFDRAEAAGADVAKPLAEVSLALAHVCDWSHDAILRERLRSRLERPEECVIETYAVLSREDDPALQQRMGALLASSVARHVRTAPKPARTARAGGRIRLGYLSADFNQHATALLMTDIFARHDRGQFEVIAFSYSRDDGSATRRRVVSAFDRFDELALESPADSAQRIAAAGVDILIDLKGYTTGARPEIAALRPAPVQVSHLGYPATMAAGWYDYVIADPVVLPMAEQPFWHERIVHMPHCYQPNDRSRPQPPPDKRSAHGLPDGAFVFACFNNTYKITPEQFALWMRILSGVPNSVLWLYAANSFAEQALRMAAARAGVAPERLHFAPAVELGAHLARQSCADLFLDTTPYGAHTTAADALWAGLPLITWAGRSFPARVAASLLLAVGLPELIAASAEDYCALALRLAGDRTALRAVASRLAQARMTAPLFDSVRYTVNLETAYHTMMERYRSGLTPEPFAVSDQHPFHRHI